MGRAPAHPLLRKAWRPRRPPPRRPLQPVEATATPVATRMAPGAVGTAELEEGAEGDRSDVELAGRSAPCRSGGRATAPPHRLRRGAARPARTDGGEGDARRPKP